MSAFRNAVAMSTAYDESRREWGDRFDAKMEPYRAELRRRLAEAGKGAELFEVLADALAEVAAPDVRRDLAAAGCTMIYDSDAGTSTKAGGTAPRWSKKSAKWVKDIGKHSVIFDLASIPEDLVLAFAAGRFRAPSTASWTEAAGFCMVDEPLEEDDGAYTEGRLQLAPSLWVAGWRMDKRQLPKRRIEQEVLWAEAAWLTAEGREKVPASVKAEIRERVTLDIVRRITPEMRVVPLTVETSTMRLLAHGTLSDKELERLVKALRNAGFAFDRHGAEDVLPLDDYYELLRTNPGTLRCDTVPGPSTEVPPEGRDARLPAHVGPEFLLWLWWRTAAGGGSGRVEWADDGASWVEWWLDGRVVLDSPPSRDSDGAESKPCAVTVGGTDPEQSIAALAALADGYLPRTIRLGFRTPTPRAQDGDGGEHDRVETVEFHATLEGWEDASVGLPSCVVIAGPDDMAAAILERLGLYDTARGLLDRLWCRYARERVGPDWRDRHQRMREWLGLAITQRFTFDPRTGQGVLFATVTA